MFVETINIIHSRAKTALLPSKCASASRKFDHDKFHQRLKRKGKVCLFLSTECCATCLTLVSRSIPGPQIRDKFHQHLKLKSASNIEILRLFYTDSGKPLNYFICSYSINTTGSHIHQQHIHSDPQIIHGRVRLTRTKVRWARQRRSPPMGVMAGQGRWSWAALRGWELCLIVDRGTGQQIYILGQPMRPWKLT